MSKKPEEDRRIVGEIIAYIRKHRSVLYTLSQDLVVPCFYDGIPTAAVSFDSTNQADCVGFLFNEEFWNDLDYKEKCFVFTHEVLHVLFDHGRRGSEYLKSLPENQRSDRVLNVSMDICINEIIVDQYVTDIDKNNSEFLSNACFIDTVFGDDASEIKRGKTFIYYYEKIMEDPALREKMEEGDQVVLIDSHDLMGEETTNDVQDRIDELLGSSGGELRDEESHKKAVSQGYGLDDSKDGRDISKEKVPETLDEYLNLYLKSSFDKTNKPIVKSRWDGHNRRTSHVLRGTNMILPQRKEIWNDRKHKIVVYADVSGSCDSYSRKFAHLIDELDEKKYEKHIYFFATHVDKAYKTKSGVFTAKNTGFGTNINGVLDHYKRVTKSLAPDAVIVLTDGIYPNISSKQGDDYKKWTFFFVKGGKWNNHPSNSSRVVMQNV